MMYVAGFSTDDLPNFRSGPKDSEPVSFCGTKARKGIYVKDRNTVEPTNYKLGKKTLQ